MRFAARRGADGPRGGARRRGQRGRPRASNSSRIATPEAAV